jgi:predicted DCC family thiol-disulfide oxidoreductase YuxK
MIKVYYDSKCGLCKREIAYYKRIAPDNIFLWCDIFISENDLKKEGINFIDSLKILHVIDHEGALHKGIDAFIIIWRYIKYFRILSFLCSIPLIKPLMNILYNIFAKWRFKRVSHHTIN